MIIALSVLSVLILGLLVWAYLDLKGRLVRAEDRIYEQILDQTQRTVEWVNRIDDDIGKLRLDTRSTDLRLQADLRGLHGTFTEFVSDLDRFVTDFSNDITFTEARRQTGHAFKMRLPNELKLRMASLASTEVNQ